MRIDNHNFIEQLHLKNEDALLYVIDEYGGLLKSVIRKNMSCIQAQQDECLRFGEEKIEIDGDWHFNLPLKPKDYSVDLADHQEVSYGKTTGKLEELKISPMAYSIKVSSSDELSDNKLIKYLENTGKMVLCLKNVKQIELGGDSWVTANQDGTWTFSVSGSFKNLILPKDMEKVMIGDSRFKF